MSSSSPPPQTAGPPSPGAAQAQAQSQAAADALALQGTASDGEAAAATAPQNNKNTEPQTAPRAAPPQQANRNSTNSTRMRYADILAGFPDLSGSFNMLSTLKEVTDEHIRKHVGIFYCMHALYQPQDDKEGYEEFMDEVLGNIQTNHPPPPIPPAADATANASANGSPAANSVNVNPPAADATANTTANVNANKAVQTGGYNDGVGEYYVDPSQNTTPEDKQFLNDIAEKTKKKEAQYKAAVKEKEERKIAEEQKVKEKEERNKKKVPWMVIPRTTTGFSDTLFYGLREPDDVGHHPFALENGAFKRTVRSIALSVLRDHVNAYFFQPPRELNSEGELPFEPEPKPDSVPYPQLPAPNGYESLNDKTITELGLPGCTALIVEMWGSLEGFELMKRPSVQPMPFDYKYEMETHAVRTENAPSKDTGKPHHGYRTGYYDGIYVPASSEEQWTAYHQLEPSFQPINDKFVDFKVDEGNQSSLRLNNDYRFYRTSQLLPITNLGKNNLIINRIVEVATLSKHLIAIKLQSGDPAWKLASDMFKKGKEYLAVCTDGTVYKGLGGGGKLFSKTKCWEKTDMPSEWSSVLQTGGGTGGPAVQSDEPKSPPPPPLLAYRDVLNLVNNHAVDDLEKLPASTDRTHSDLATIFYTFHAWCSPLSDSDAYESVMGAFHTSMLQCSGLHMTVPIRSDFKPDEVMIGTHGFDDDNWGSVTSCSGDSLRSNARIMFALGNVEENGAVTQKIKVPPTINMDKKTERIIRKVGWLLNTQNNDLNEYCGVGRESLDWYEVVSTSAPNQPVRIRMPDKFWELLQVTRELSGNRWHTATFALDVRNGFHQSLAKEYVCVNPIPECVPKGVDVSMQPSFVVYVRHNETAGTTRMTSASRWSDPWLAISEEETQRLDADIQTLKKLYRDKLIYVESYHQTLSKRQGFLRESATGNTQRIQITDSNFDLEKDEGEYFTRRKYHAEGWPKEMPAKTPAPNKPVPPPKPANPKPIGTSSGYY